MFLFLWVFVVFAYFAEAQFSVYRPKDGQVIFDGKSTTSTITTTSSATATGPAATFTNAAAYNQDTLQAPALPVPAPPTQFSIQLVDGGMTNLSIKQNGNFYGFSIEMSVAEMVLGKNSSLLQVPFLNLMANIKERVGSVLIRVGGNTQEAASMASSLPNGTSVSKYTGTVQWTPDLLYTMSNISALTNARWLLGVPFFQTSPFDLDIVEQGKRILGDNVFGYQAGNEPDLYATHGNRPSTYSPQDYFNEFGSLISQIGSDSNVPTKNLLVGPSLAGSWNLQDVWDTGFITSYSDSLALLSVEHYPDSACTTVTDPVDPQTAFDEYLTHSFNEKQVAKYLSSTALAQQVGKQFLMSETNTGSCGGWPGLSDSFGAGLWALDYGMQLAYSNFTGALLHVGGLTSYYNPFFSPPTNQSRYREWTVGPVYYSAMIMAEVLGSSNASQVVDLQANAASDYTPGYAIYENGSPTKLALFNLMTDPSGASDYTAIVSISGVTLPSQVSVKYFRSSSVSDKTGYTWANQSFGAPLQSDGRLQGDLNVQTVACDQTTNTCSITVPAPSFALVFLTSDASSEASPPETLTFSTSTVTVATSASIDPGALATSNGHHDMGLGGDFRGTTSPGSAGNAATGLVVPCTLALLLSLTLGLSMMLRLL